MTKLSIIPLVAVAAIVQSAFADDYNFIEGNIGGPAQQMQGNMFRFIDMAERIIAGKVSPRDGAQSILRLTENMERHGKKLAQYAKSHPQNVKNVCKQFGDGVFARLIQNEAKMLQALKAKNYFNHENLRYICKEYEKAMKKYDFRSIFL